MDLPLPADIADLLAQLEAAEQDAQAIVAGVPDALGSRRPAPERWSIAECFEHLAISHRAYLPALEQAADLGRAQGRFRIRPATPGSIGRLFVHWLEPPPRWWSKMRAPRRIRPGARASLAEAYTAFLATQADIRAFVRAHADLDLAGIRFRNPFIRGVRFSLATGLHVLTAHARRHLLQARQVRQALEQRAGGAGMRRITIARIALPVGLFLLPAGQLPAQRTTSGSYIALPAPTLIIGREGDEDYEFTSVAAAYRLPTGAVAIADWRIPSIRLYDATGRLSRKLGREGAGPGEFRSVHSLLLAGDTLIAYDWNLLRLTRYLPTGTLLGTQPVQTSARVDVVGRLTNGRWLVATLHSPSWNHGPGIYRDTLAVGTIAPSSVGPIRWAGSFPGATFFAYMPGRDKSQWAVGWAFFAPTSAVGALGDTIVVGDTGTSELLYLLADGHVARRVTIPLEGTPDLTPHRNAARDEALAQAGPRTNRAYIEAAYAAPRPTPRYRDFLVAADGSLWIQLFEPHPADSARYMILAPTGAVRARVSLPPRSRVLTVQSPWLLALLTDPTDVERVGVIRWDR
jgi:hypothetical protein